MSRLDTLYAHTTPDTLHIGYYKCADIFVDVYADDDGDVIENKGIWREKQGVVPGFVPLANMPFVDQKFHILVSLGFIRIWEMKDTNWFVSYPSWIENTKGYNQNYIHTYTTFPEAIYNAGKFIYTLNTLTDTYFV